MAKKNVFFLTGANARILLNNKTVAYATDISYRVTVRHASPRVLGRFEVETHQPLTYDVEGQLTIIKYARGLKKYLKDGAPNDVADQGSGIGSYKVGSIGGTVGGALGLPSADGQFDGAADENFIPGRMFQSKMFDIEIRQKIPDVPDEGPGSLLEVAQAFFSALNDALAPNPTNPGKGETTVALLRDCRFTDLDFQLTKRGVAMQRLRFVARYADDDTYIARKSGVGQELS
jgi:hypothetical protein